MGLFGRKKEKSSKVAKDRLKLVLIYDRVGTGSNNEMLHNMKRDILEVIQRYIEIEEDEFELDIKNTDKASAAENAVSSELVAVIPIKKVKKLGKNTYR